MTTHWVLATTNVGKLNEFQAMLNFGDIKLIPKDHFNIPTVDETGATFVENAILKARTCSRYSSCSALADDSGLIIDALQGEPGVISARYAGPEADDISNRQLVIDKLQALSNEGPFKARFICVLVLMRHSQDPAPLIAQGEWQGEITLTPRGHQGFGYDPIFWVPELQCTAAELAPDQKNKLSHRAHALRKLKALFD